MDSSSDHHVAPDNYQHKGLAVTFSNHSIDQAYQAVLEKHFPERARQPPPKDNKNVQVHYSDSASSRKSSVSEQSSDIGSDSASLSISMSLPDSNGSLCTLQNVNNNNNTRTSCDSSSTIVGSSNIPSGCEDGVSVNSNLNLGWLFNSSNESLTCEGGADDVGSTNETVSSLVFSSDVSPVSSPMEDADSEVLGAEESTKEMGAIPKRRARPTQQSGKASFPSLPLINRICSFVMQGKNIAQSFEIFFVCFHDDTVK